MQSPVRRRVVVLGGGIAGLAAAYRLVTGRDDVDVTVLEGSPQVGGKLLLGEVAGLPVDLGAESILHRRPEGTELARSVGLADAVVHPATIEAGLWTRGGIAALPPGLMGVPGSLSTAVRSRALSRRGAIRAAPERLLPAPDVTSDRAVGELVARRLGPEIRDRLVEPLLGGVYAGHSDELSLHATVPQLVHGVEEHGGLLAAASAHVQSTRVQGSGAARTPVFAGVEGGVGRLATETARAVERAGGSVRTSAMVRDVTRTATGWRLQVGPTRSPEEVTADAVVVALPAVPASRLLESAAPQAARELARIEYASMAVVTLAVAREAVPASLSGSGFLVPPIDGHTIKAATYSSRKWAWQSGDTFLMRCSIGRHREEAVLQRSDAEMVAEAMADLQEAIGLHGPLLDVQVTRWGGALPQYAVGHLDRVASIRAAVSELPGLAVCGAAYDGLGIPAVIGSADAAATQVSEHLDRIGTMAP